MLANALKSISATNITANYEIQKTVTSTAGPWKIYPAKKKSTGRECSVFVFDKKSFDAHGSSLGRSGAAAFKKSSEEVVERLKKEASCLARLRHPGILELIEPVEETRGGGLQFVTEPVTASLSSLLQEKDQQEKGGGRASRYVTEDADGNRRRRELEIDELEIQKGLIQVSKALEFLHEQAGLVHGNLTPDAVLVNAKSDWKLSGLGFCSPPEPPLKATSVQPISLSEVLQYDNRLPSTVQLSLDYTSPDFVLDQNLTTSADMFSLGLLCIALYNSPHRSPLECHNSLTTYKSYFRSSQSMPTTQNNYLSSRPLPKDLSNYVLPKLVARRPAQRMTLKEFQESEFFDNMLVRSIRFLDTFPTKTPTEKTKFLRGLVKVLHSFPKSVLEKKMLPALLEELKDKELIALILANVFKIIELLPSGKRAFGDKVRPRLKEIFVTNAKQSQEKDPARDAGLMVVIEQLGVIADNCPGGDFKDDILPIFYGALEAPTPPLVDAALRSLPTVLPVLDFSTIKNELFPVIALIFSRTNSMAIKIRGLQAFVTLCGGSNDPGGDDGLDGLAPDKKKATSSCALDKYTMQEKIVPLVKGIKTKEPDVMMAALRVLRVVGDVADAEFAAQDILPVLWTMALGPLLNMKQFKAFMELIKSLSHRVEEEQIKKLQDMSGSVGNNPTSPAAGDDFMTLDPSSVSGSGANGNDEDDFMALVKGRPGGTQSPMDTGWDAMSSPIGASTTTPAMASVASASSTRRSTPTATFSWSTPPAAAPTTAVSQLGSVSKSGTFRTVTPDLASFTPLAPTTTQYSQPLQPTNAVSSLPATTNSQTASLNWATGTNTSSINSSPAAGNIWSQPALQAQPPTSSFGSMTLGQQKPQQQPSLSSLGSGSGGSFGRGFSLAPPPSASTPSQFSLAPPPGTSQSQQNTGLSSFGGGSGLGSIGGGMGGMSMNSLSSLGGTNRPAAGATANSFGFANSGMGRGNMGGMSMNSLMGQQQQQQPPPQQQQQQQKSGLDKYESLL